MQGDLSLSIPMLLGFALTLARLAGIFVFLPIPGAQTGPSAARVILALACTIAVSSRWPQPEGLPGAWTVAGWLAGEASLGLLVGVIVGLVAEAFLLGAQILSMPAGYAYASAFDPNTQADSGILLVFAQLMAGLLFFTTGLDRQVMYAFAESLTTYPPGTFTPTAGMALEAIRFGASIFTLALRLAMPVLGLLLLVDIALGVLGRLNPNVQTVHLAFPAKMLISLVMLSMTLSLVPRLYQSHANHAMETIRTFMVGR